MEVDISIIVWIQDSFGLGSKPFFDFFSEIGTDLPKMLIIALTFWLAGSTLGLRTALVVILSGYINGLLKVFIAQPRPYFISDKVHTWNDSDGFGMPSGHAQSAATLWGTLAYYLKRRIIYALAFILIFFIGLSRIYYASHSPTQVFVGWMIGILFVIALVKFEHPFLNWFKRFNIRSQVGLVILATAILLGVRITIVPAIASSFEIPFAWNARYQAAQQFENELEGKEGDEDFDELELFDDPGFQGIGTFLGMSLCGIYFLKVGGVEFRALRQKVLNVVVGIVIFIMLVPVIKLLEESDFGSFVLGVLIPFVLALVVPSISTWILTRLRLSESTTR